MTGQRCDDQNTRSPEGLVPRQIAVELNQAAERPFPDHLLANGHGASGNDRRPNAKLRLFIAPRRALDQFRRRRGASAHRRMSERVEWVPEQEFRRTRNRARRFERGLGEFVHMVEHGSRPPENNQITPTLARVFTGLAASGLHSKTIRQSG